MRAKEPYSVASHSGRRSTAIPAASSLAASASNSVTRMVGREIVGIGRERGKDGHSGLLLPDLVRTSLDAEVFSVPRGPSIRFLAAKEEPANSRHAHTLTPWFRIDLLS
jgi:hypothetical protein